MADKIVMPQLGESIAEGTIVKWLKQPGDAVKKDENILLISTDKVEAEIPAHGRDEDPLGLGAAGGGWRCAARTRGRRSTC